MKKYTIALLGILIIITGCAAKSIEKSDEVEAPGVVEKEGGVWVEVVEEIPVAEVSGGNLEDTSIKSNSDIFSYSEITNAKTGRSELKITGFASEKSHIQTRGILWIPPVHEGMAITRIEANAFKGTGVSEVHFTEAGHLEVIEKGAFEGNFIVDVYFSGADNLRIIEANSFSNNYLSDIDFSGNPKLELVDEEAFSNNQG